MTDINTAALRASLERRGVIGALRTYDLCDALDAARAELKVVKDFKDYMLAHDPGPFVTELEERAAELTEQRNTWRERAQEQEARAEAAELQLARRDAAIAAGQNAAINRQENGL